jgi:hypothetical protein
MAQTGYTPIQLYHSTTPAATPSGANLAAGEVAINVADGKLFYKDDGGTVRLLASKDAAAGTFTTLAASGNATVGGTLGVTGGLTAGSINNTTIGATTPSTGAFTTLAASGAVSFSGTGAATLNVGTTAERPTPATGMLRFNSTLGKFEGYGGTAWGAIGGGATGGGADEIFIENGQNVTVNYTLPATKNALSTGPITIDSGVEVTVSSGARWLVL